MNLATGPLLGRIGAAVLTQAVLSYVSVIEENLQVSFPSAPGSHTRTHPTSKAETDSESRY